MIYKDTRISDIQIAYIGGGSMGWAWTFMTDLSLDDKISGSIRLYDINHEAAKRNEVIGNSLSEDPKRKGKWLYTSSSSLEDALTGADFVIISILPGTFEEMRSDVHAPEKYGINQPVGDTTGPGGLIRSLRTIPMYVTIAEAIKKYSPKAWVINYTNPMAICIRTLYRVFPEVKAFGCCHEVFSTQKLLASMCMEELGIEHIDRNEIYINVIGINHFTWIDHASYKGIDLFPMYERFVNEHYYTGYPKSFEGYKTNVFACSNRVKFDLFRKYGLMAAAGDRHLAEFLPPYYLKDIDTAHSYGFTFTSVDYRLDDLENRIKRSKRLLTGEDKLDYSPSGEESILLIKSLLGLERTISNVNLPNLGQIPNLPLGAIVETNSLFERNHIAPILAGKLPDNVKALIDPHIQNQADIMEAGLNYDRELAFKAFTNDPLLTISKNDARKLFDQMLENTKAYLPTEWF